ncbi:MAG: zinc ribbon domain-containing protein [Nostoc sp.]|uniref:zinc ribbon domain-containing protein n=1 Tax=Nostoc sp. TaxID=1180 RepID=UPI002FF76677
MKLFAIPAEYTSPKCSDCGVIGKKSLSTHTDKCNCGCELQRYTNVAINILNLGIARMGHIERNKN